MHHRKASYRLAQGTSNPLYGADEPSARVVTAGASHDVSQHQRQQRIEKPASDAVKDLSGDDPGRLIGNCEEKPTQR